MLDAYISPLVGDMWSVFHLKVGVVSGDYDLGFKVEIIDVELLIPSKYAEHHTLSRVLSTRKHIKILIILQCRKTRSHQSIRWRLTLSPLSPMLLSMYRLSASDILGWTAGES